MEVFKDGLVVKIFSVHIDISVLCFVTVIRQGILGVIYVVFLVDMLNL